MDFKVEIIIPKMNTIAKILIIGIIAGTLDAIAAIVVFNSNPFRMFQFIASGVLGKEAFAGGNNSMLLGVLFHFLIAISWTGLFFLIYQKMPQGGRNRLLTGIIFGITIWCVMNLVVLPFSRVPQRPMTFSQALAGISILVCAVGIPVSFMTHFYLKKNREI